MQEDDVGGGWKMASSDFSASQEEMIAARVPLGARDACVKLLIPLNKCRVESMYLPWKCEEERHAYEKCEYHLFLRRMKKMQELRQRDTQLQPAPN
jgi:NADH dehydrogenase (ubiquinone) 1 beta subcomplex subunit 7